MITQSEYEKLKAEGNKNREQSKSEKSETAIATQSQTASPSKQREIGNNIKSPKKNRNEFKKVSVEIPMIGGKEVRSGVAIGDFLVEKNKETKSYQVTHIPTGFRVSNEQMINNADGKTLQSKAKTIAKKLHAAKLTWPHPDRASSLSQDELIKQAEAIKLAIRFY